MRSMTAMASRRGRGEAGIAGSIAGDCGTESGSTGSTLAMFMLGSGPVGSAMGVEFTLVRMGVSMLESSILVLNMDLGIIISEMGTPMLGNISQTRCMVLGSIGLQMDIGMKVPGTKEGGRGLVCTLSEMAKRNLATGKMGSSTVLACKIQILNLLLL